MSLVRQIVTTYQRVLVHFLLVILQIGYRQTWLMVPFSILPPIWADILSRIPRVIMLTELFLHQLKTTSTVFPLVDRLQLQNLSWLVQETVSSRCTNRDEAVRNAFPTSAVTEMHKMKLRIKRKVQIKVLSSVITSVWFLKRQIIHNLIKHNREGAVERRKWSDELSQLF